MSLDEYRKANRANWDDRAAAHWDTDVYPIHRFVDDPAHVSDVVEFDRTELGDVAGRSLLHLQCHIGTDTVSWARLGANVTGIDLSPGSIERARELARLTSTPARFEVAELYDSPNVVRETFDVVYTGIGALPWLPDIAGWGRIVAGFLKPGGTFYVREGHPMLFTIDDERTDDRLELRYPYFSRDEPLRFDDATSYAGAERGELDHPTHYEWSHGLGEIVTALVDAGLRIDFLHEHRFLDWQALPSLVQGEDGFWRLSEGADRLPLCFSLRATRV